MGGRTSAYKPLDNDYEFRNIVPAHNQSVRRVHFIDEPFDLFTLIWLDEQSKGNTLKTLETKKLILEISKDCLFYENSDSFFHDINTMKFTNKKILLIVWGSLVEKVLSKSNVREIISAVIIFCEHPNQCCHLKSDFIVDVCTDRESLKDSITSEMASLKLNLFENQPFKSVQSLTEDNVSSGIYFKYMLFIELFKRMPQTTEAKEAMLKQAENHYHGNDACLKEIHEFRQNYTPDQALKWYTRDGFVYRLVNLAFRTEDITLWHAFRYYITDLCKQLEEIHRDQEKQYGARRLILYRGQSKMPKKELENIRSRVGRLVATTGFFSTSSDQAMAMGFVFGAPSNDEYVPVIYEIIVDTKITKNIVFADVVKYLSSANQINDQIQQEKEILFNIGSVFKITDVYRAQDLWYIRMEGTDVGIRSIKSQIKSMVEKFQTEHMNILFGQHVLDMGYYSAADEYFQRMLRELPKGHKHIALVYDFMGDRNMRITNWKEALVYFDRAYTLKQQYRSTNHPDFGMTLNHIGNYHQAIGDNDSALHFYRKSLKCVKDPFNHSEALKTHFTQEKYGDAEASYLNAFIIARRFLFIDDGRLIKSIDSLATIYRIQDHHHNQRALDFCQEQLASYQEDLPENHIAIGHILMIGGKFSGTIDHYETALTIFEKKISQAYAATANCLILLSEHYNEQHMDEKAYSLGSRANEIQRKIYPANHSSIVDNENLLNRIQERLTEEPLV